MIKTILIASIIGGAIGYSIAYYILKAKYKQDIDNCEYWTDKLGKDNYNAYIYAHETDSFLKTNPTCSTKLYKFRLND